jgi:LDH2 family malate/lactate/ureidoglycolate dehydrogenase
MILERFKVPEKDQVLVSEAALRRTVTQIFEKLGVTPEDAAVAADVLTMIDLRGVETHGVSNMLRAYVRVHKEVIQWFGECTREMGLPPLAVSSLSR